MGLLSLLPTHLRAHTLSTSRSCFHLTDFIAQRAHVVAPPEASLSRVITNMFSSSLPLWYGSGARLLLRWVRRWYGYSQVLTLVRTYTRPAGFPFRFFNGRGERVGNARKNPSVRTSGKLGEAEMALGRFGLFVDECERGAHPAVTADDFKIATPSCFDGARQAQPKHIGYAHWRCENGSKRLENIQKFHWMCATMPTNTDQSRCRCVL